MSDSASPSGAESLDGIFAQSMAAFQRRDFARAIELGDRLLRLSNEAGPAILWGVRLRLEAGRWSEAIELGSPGLDKSPGLSGLVGHAFEASGNLVEAQNHFERAAREQPENAGWHYHNASALSRLYRDFESMEVLRRAVAVAPNPQGLLMLGGLNLKFGDPVEAERLARQVHPKSEEAYILLARSLMDQGRADEADAVWSEVIRLNPKNESLPLQRGIALVRQGEFDRGVEALQKIVAGSPRFVPALVQIATAKKVTEEDRPLVVRMEELYADDRYGVEEKIALGYALGKSYDNLREYESAMRRFDEANALRFSAIENSGGFDRAGYAANMALRTRVYADEVIKSRAPEGNGSAAPIFVLGVIRSGTTLAEQILSANPLVAGAGELDFWINADIRLMDYALESLNLSVLREGAETYLRLLEGFANGAERVVDKQPGNLILAGALHIAFPNARIIHMRRNPRDIAVSIWTTNVRTSTRFVNHKGNIAYALRQHETLLDHWRQVLPANRYMDISYESLITDRENVTRRMLEFCDLPWDEACLAPERNRNSVITPSLWQVRQPVYRTSIDRWKNYEPWLGEFADLSTS